MASRPGLPITMPSHLRPCRPAQRTSMCAARKVMKAWQPRPMAAFLYPLLEGPIWDAEKKDWEKTADGKQYLRILEFDVANEKWTGRHWKYVLEQNGNAIGDFNMISPTQGLDHRARRRRGHGRQGLPGRTEAAETALTISPSSSASTKSRCPMRMPILRCARSPISI